MGDPVTKSGRLNDRGRTVQPSHLQLTVGWLILAAWIAGLDASAINWAITSREGIPGPGGGPCAAFSKSYQGYDGSVVVVVRNDLTGKNVATHLVKPPTAAGLCYVWWPSFAGGLLTPTALALVATRNGRRFIVEFPLPRMTTRRWTIAVAVICVEAGLIIGAVSYFVVGPRSSLWPPILIFLAGLHTVTFVPACARTRSAGAEMNSFGSKW
jgi:hypothetical protein